MSNKNKPCCVPLQPSELHPRSLVSTEPFVSVKLGDSGSLTFNKTARCSRKSCCSGISQLCWMNLSCSISQHGKSRGAHTSPHSFLAASFGAASAQQHYQVCSNTEFYSSLPSPQPKPTPSPPSWLHFHLSGPVTLQIPLASEECILETISRILVPVECLSVFLFLQ